MKLLIKKKKKDWSVQGDRVCTGAVSEAVTLNAQEISASEPCSAQVPAGVVAAGQEESRAAHPATGPLLAKVLLCWNLEGSAAVRGSRNKANQRDKVALNLKRMAPWRIVRAAKNHLKVRKEQ